MTTERLLPFAEMLDAISRKDKQKVPLKKRAGRQGKCHVPRETVLLIRKAWEEEGKSYRQIMKITGLSYDYIRQVCEGLIRTDIRTDLP